MREREISYSTRRMGVEQRVRNAWAGSPSIFDIG